MRVFSKNPGEVKKMKTCSRGSLEGGLMLIVIVILSVFLVTAADQDTVWAQWSSKSKTKAQQQPVEKVEPIRLQVSATSLTAGDETKFTVTGGKEPITVKTGNEYILSIKQDGPRAGIITGKSQGSADVLASDAGGRRASVRVDVKAPKPLNAYMDKQSIPIGEEAKLAVTGGVKPYKIQKTSNSNVAIEQKDGSTFAVKGRDAGTTEIVVQDNLGKTRMVSLTITIPPLKASIDKSNIAREGSAWVDVKGGIPPYQLVGNGYNVRVTQTKPDRFFVKPQSEGSGSINFKDSKGQKASVNYSIYYRLRSYLNYPELYIGGETRNATLLVAEGVRPYTVVEPSGMTTITASKLPPQQGINGQNYLVTGVREGTAEITAKDSVGQVVKVRFKVTKREALQKSCTPDKSTYVLKDKLICTIRGGKTPYHNATGQYSSAKVTQTRPDAFSIEFRQKGKAWMKIEDSIKQFVQWEVEVK